jgi:hypothetical protein
MSPELDRLLEALYERDHCEPNQRSRCDRNLHRLMVDALQRLPGVNESQLLEALGDRYHQFKKARKTISSLPPKA